MRILNAAVMAAAAVMCPLTLAAQGDRTADVSPLTIGETFVIESQVLAEHRRINVYLPPAYSATPDVRLPVLYMPDGGIYEDFLHVAGLVQISVLNGTMRPFMLVGIENTARRRDLTGPTDNAEDRSIAPEVGGSAAFRRFIRSELMPAVEARYRTTGESAIVGESLAGLFVVETYLLEPDLFDTYIAFDPSLWWNDGRLVEAAGVGSQMWRGGGAAVDRERGVLRRPTLYLASSSEQEIAGLTRRLAEALRSGDAPPGSVHYVPMVEETHATIYHPAALRAFRRVFRPDPEESGAG
ncbi:MAG TPA: alpha/beta hydrolase-fold protein [Longimicrobiales bacterium]|nr:alpha/beta hydrolase-fold protein [Longimicrobiales bacterium]